MALFALFIGVSMARADDLKKMNGTWVPTEVTLAGEKPPEEFSKFTLTMNDGRYTVDVGGQKETGSIQIDEKKKPATIDISPEDGPQKGKKILAIYELSGDTLKACYTITGTERPKDFSSTKENKQFLVLYKRKK